jgi:hypothetical protein
MIDGKKLRIRFSNQCENGFLFSFENIKLKFSSPMQGMNPSRGPLRLIIIKRQKNSDGS